MPALVLVLLLMLLSLAVGADTAMMLRSCDMVIVR